MGVWKWGSGVRLNPAASASGRDSPSRARFTAPTFGKQSEEADSQVLQRVQARERLLRHGTDLVPLQEPGEEEEEEVQFQTSLVRRRATVAVETHSFFSFSRAAKGPFMSSIVQEISFFWRSL